jgi:hypothetical protein
MEEVDMLRLLLAGLLLATATTAAARCTDQTIIVGSRIINCSTCCTNGQCTTFCS